MPVTKTAKRTERGSNRKQIVNSLIVSRLEAAVRQAKKTKSAVTIAKAVSLADRAAKKHTIHKNKAGRIKSAMAKLSPKKTKK